MPLIQFCSNCWAENLFGATVCERCGTPLSETEPIFYDQKLMRALHHPVPETREMAAMLLAKVSPDYLERQSYRWEVWQNGKNRCHNQSHYK